MQLDRETLGALARDSLREPRQAARRLLDLGGGFGLALTAALAVAALTALVSATMGLVLPPSGNPAMDGLMAQPLALAALQMGGFLLAALLATWAGRIFGGRGRLDQALILVAWLEFLFLILQLVLSLLMLALPGFSDLALLAAMGLVLWLSAAFLAELHAFKSTLATGAGLFAVVLLIGMALMPLAMPV